MSDPLWIRQNGLEAGIQKATLEGCRIFGICGGYQMLGQRLLDPDGCEHGGELAGLGLLPVTTTFGKRKHRTRVEGRVEPIEGIYQGMSGVSAEGCDETIWEKPAFWKPGDVLPA